VTKRRSLRSCRFQLGLGDKTAFWGAMPGAEAMRVLLAADVLVLASRMDGYGAVVNEALYRGVPVVCSAAAGACQLIRQDPALGSVFSSSLSLKHALNQWIDQGVRSAERTERSNGPASVYFQTPARNIFWKSSLIFPPVLQGRCLHGNRPFKPCVPKNVRLPA